uniref:Uncharacterized protein n=1 Tax=Cannabis sativa TaxID=3483 RepID=A0A803Q688_CANSA
MIKGNHHMEVEVKEEEVIVEIVSVPSTSGNESPSSAKKLLCRIICGGWSAAFSIHPTSLQVAYGMTAMISTRRGVELANLAKRLHTSLLVFGYSSITKWLCLKIGSYLAPFMADLLDQYANTYSKLGSERLFTVASEYSSFMADYLKHQTVGASLLAERCSALVKKMTIEVDNLKLSILGLSEREKKQSRPYKIPRSGNEMFLKDILEIDATEKPSKNQAKGTDPKATLPTDTSLSTSIVDPASKASRPV